MHIEKLKSIQECLAGAAEAQIYDLENVNAQELGEVIDIIKDIEETIYYCTVTKAMKDSEKHKGEEMMYYTPMYYNGDRGNGNGMYYTEGNKTDGRDMPRMYYNGSSSRGGNGSGSSMNGNGNSSHYSEREFPMAFSDGREGRSPRSRRMYMEAKETHQDKATQMRELEKYMQELAQDVTEMIQDASPEERQYLSKKISALATKLSQANG